MSGENLVKLYLGALDRVRDRALGMLGSGSPRSLAHRSVGQTVFNVCVFDGRGPVAAHHICLLYRSLIFPVDMAPTGLLVTPRCLIWPREAGHVGRYH